MSARLNRTGYQRLVDENIAWLLEQPRTLEREHVVAIVRHSVDMLYPEESAVNFIRGLLEGGDGNVDIFDVIRQTRDKYTLSIMDIQVLLNYARDQNALADKCEAMVKALEEDG